MHLLREMRLNKVNKDVNIVCVDFVQDISWIFWFRILQPWNATICMSAKCYWIAPFPRNEDFLCENFEGNKSMTTYPEFTIAKKISDSFKTIKKICSDICARTLFVQRCENCKLWGQIFDGFEGKLSTTMYCEGRILSMYNECASGEFKITRNKFFVTPSQSCYLTFSELGNLTANFNVLIGSPKAGVY